MANDDEGMRQNHRHEPLTDEEIRAHTVGDVTPLDSRVIVTDYDPRWPDWYRQEAGRVAALLGDRVLRLEHTGSTSVRGLAAKPVIDMLLVVANSADEPAYVPLLEAGGYTLRIREPDWHQHRMFKGPNTDINLHAFSAGCSEIERMLVFRDWLRKSPSDRDLYARTKLALAQREWTYVQNYADAKTSVIEEIMARAAANKP